MPKKDDGRRPPEDERRPAGLLDRMDEIEARRSAKTGVDPAEPSGDSAAGSTGEAKVVKRELDLDDVW